MQEKKTTGLLRVFILLTFAHLGGRKDDFILRAIKSK